MLRLSYFYIFLISVEKVFSPEVLYINLCDRRYIFGNPSLLQKHNVFVLRLSYFYIFLISVEKVFSPEVLYMQIIFNEP